MKKILIFLLPLLFIVAVFLRFEDHVGNTEKTNDKPSQSVVEEKEYVKEQVKKPHQTKSFKRVQKPKIYSKTPSNRKRTAIPINSKKRSAWDAREDLRVRIENMQKMKFGELVKDFRTVNTIKIGKDGSIDSQGCARGECGHFLNSYRGKLHTDENDADILVSMKPKNKKTGIPWEDSCIGIYPEDENPSIFSIVNKNLKLLSNNKRKNEFIIQLGQNQFFHIAYNGFYQRKEHARGLYYLQDDQNQMNLIGEVSLEFTSGIPIGCQI